MWWRRLRYLAILTALSAIATCPAAQRACTAKARAREAEQLLGYLADRVAAAVAATGRVPALPAGPTPAVSCCDRGGICEPDPADWSTPGWQALAFSIDGPYRYSYTYAPTADGRAAVLRATGDLDCDGEPALYELELRVEGPAPAPAPAPAPGSGSAAGSATAAGSGSAAPAPAPAGSGAGATVVRRWTRKAPYE